MLLHLALVAAWLRNPRARHLLSACGAAIGLTLAAATAILVVTVRRDAIANAERELSNTAYILAEEIDRRFQAAEVVQDGLISAMRDRSIDSAPDLSAAMALPSVLQDLRQRVAGISGLDFLAVVDRNGILLGTSRLWPVPQTDVADRDYIRALIRDPGRGWFISTPVRDPASGDWTEVFSRAFTASDGQLLGIVCVGIQLRSLQSLFAGIVMRQQSSIGLFRSDGVLLARYPPVVAEIGASFDGPSASRAALAATGKPVLRRRSVLDGMERLIAAHDVAHYPLTVSATNTMQAVLAEWRLLARWMIAGTALTELILGAIIVLAVRQLKDQERLSGAYAAQLEAEAGRAVAESELERACEREQHERQARLEAMRLDTAISHMHQGLLMFDGERRLLVVNARFSRLFGLPPGALWPSMPYAEFVQAIQAQGNVPPDDLRSIVSQRAEMVEHQVRASFVWEVSDGRVFSVTHQPMEEGWIATYEDISERRRMDARIAYMARHDALTDLANRVLFHEQLELALAFARRGRMVALLCLDLDQFKAVNDTLGHPVGDALLQAVAHRLRQNVRDTDNIARLGGDEFAIIQPMVDKPAAAAVFAARLIDLLEQPFDVAGHQIVIGTSIGIAFAPEDGASADVLLKNADLALYRAKLDGRGVYRMFHAAMDAELQARRELEVELRAALPATQLELFYQPLIGLHGGVVAGFEALLRWRHPVKGLVPPGQFIPLAEEIGLIVPIGEWVLHEACAKAAGWPDGITIAVNLSAVQFKSRNLVAAVASALDASGLAAERLELEITETVMLQDTAATLATLQELHALGVRIAMDDFGTGYSSLSYLRRFPFDRIKIDQSFVRELGTQHDSGAIVRAVLGLSHELGIATTAEGVETPEQLRVLASAGCSDIQGYLFSPPVPAAEIPALLRRAPLWAAELLAPSRAA